MSEPLPPDPGTIPAPGGDPGPPDQPGKKPGDDFRPGDYVKFQDDTGRYYLGTVFAVKREGDGQSPADAAGNPMFITIIFEGGQNFDRLTIIRQPKDVIKVDISRIQ